MSWIAILALAYLAVANARLAKSWFYPPVVFSGLWAGLIFFLEMSGDRFHPLLVGTLAVFVAGAVCFSLGGIIGLAIPQREHAPLSTRHRQALATIFNMSLLAMLVCCPYYLWRLNDIINSSRILYDPFVALRYELSNVGDGGSGLGYFKYLIALFDMLTITAWIECDQSVSQRRRCWLMAAGVLGYHLTTAGRSGAMLFLFTLMWIVFLRRRKIAVGPAVVGVIVFVAIFSGAAILLGKGGYRDGNLVENAASIFSTLTFYVLSGLVAFNEVVSNPAVIQQNMFSFFHSVANAFGADYDIARYENTYVQTPEWTNIFTIHASPYAQFGIPGVVLYMLLLGGVCAVIYVGAKRRTPWATLLYARFLGCLFFTGAGDPFLQSLSSWIQLAVFSWGIYYLPRYFLGKHSRCENTWCDAGTRTCSQIG